MINQNFILISYVSVRLINRFHPYPATSSIAAIRPATNPFQNLNLFGLQQPENIIYSSETQSTTNQISTQKRQFKF